jgi:hypothetical protein
MGTLSTDGIYITNKRLMQQQKKKLKLYTTMHFARDHHPENVKDCGNGKKRDFVFVYLNRESFFGGRA